jgi:hypothetical protein
MSLLEHPEALALLADAEVSAAEWLRISRNPFCNGSQAYVPPSDTANECRSAA